MNIKYVTGDATLPQGEGNKIIAHICNDVGAWGAGFVMALSARDMGPQMSYQSWYFGEEEALVGGRIQMVPDFMLQGDVWVCNMIAQRSVGDMDGVPPIRYTWLATCLVKLRKAAQNMRPQASVHMPRIGTGLAGGKWENIEALIENLLCGHDVPVTVYDLPPPMTPSELAYSKDAATATGMYDHD